MKPVRVSATLFFQFVTETGRGRSDVCSNPQQVFYNSRKSYRLPEICHKVAALAAGGCEACQLAPIGAGECPDCYCHII